MATAASYANLNVVALLDNPRSYPKYPKTTYFDAYVYIGPTEDDVLIGCVRHFSDMPVRMEPGMYQCIIMLAASHKDVDYCIQPQAELGVGDEAAHEHKDGKVLKAEDYTFVGDLKHCFPMDSGDARRGYMHVSGAVIKTDSATSSFHLDVEQYTASYADLANKAKDTAAQTNTPVVATPRSILPVLAVIPDSGRFKKGKPLPFVNKFVMFGGFLTGVSDVLDDVGIKKRFRIEVDNIAFLGNIPGAASTPASAPVMASSSGGSMRPRFSDYKKNAKRPRTDSDAFSSSPTPGSTF